ncbi:MAG TPA: PDDEXK nuclease domain-containing protein [Longimicrobium sp.]|nr:PDDEXK nuclease domain-containing protein [Longimicrobium sp.]
MPSDEDRDLPVAPGSDTAGEVVGYGELLESLKSRIRHARLRATLAVNRELVSLYWQIGREILVRQEAEGWGTKVIDRLAADLQREFPEMTGLSRTNLKYMRSLAEAYPGNEIGQQAVGQIPWGHNIVLLTRLGDPVERLWYAARTVEHGWSRAVLVHQIESGLHARQGQAITNFERTLPRPQSDLARDLLKDPYNFGFLSLGAEVREREIERALVAHVRDFLLEMGVGFAFVNSQYRLEVEGREYRLDLLFYHLRLRCFVVVELKVGAFEPEYAGKMNFYLAAVDDQLRKEGDQPSIGLILCKERNRVVVEYALRGTNQPIGVAAYRLTETLPHALRGAIPSPEELERELRESTDADE